MFNVHVRSFCLPTHRETVVLLVQVEGGDTDLCVNNRMRCVMHTDSIVGWYILVPCWGIAAFPVQPVGIPGRTRCVLCRCAVSLRYSLCCCTGECCLRLNWPGWGSSAALPTVLEPLYWISTVLISVVYLKANLLGLTQVQFNKCVQLSNRFEQMNLKLLDLI